MTARQALFYNLLSSVLAYLGMIIGVCVGNISSASFWIFAMTAGMFLYIALVDMVSYCSDMVLGAQVFPTPVKKGPFF
jgi:zinc transporter 10